MPEGMLSSLAGVLVGGLVTYLATRTIETQRWGQEKKNRLATAKREAIGRALAWLDPMDRALTSANLMVSSLLQFTLEYEEFYLRFPHLIADLAKMDLPADLRLLLPPRVYAEGHQIVRAFDEVHTQAILLGQRAKLEGKPMLGLKECGEKLDAIGRQIEGFREKLSQAYLATFD